MIFSRLENLSDRPISSSGVLVALHGVVYGTALVAFWPAASLVALGLCSVLVAISVVDIRRFEIPDILSLILVLSGAALLIGEPNVERLYAVAAGVAFPALLYLVGRLYMRARGHPGLGLGDVKLAAGLGLWLGIEGSVWTLLAASLSGIATLLVFAALRRVSVDALAGSGVAFGPFLCLSAWVIWLNGMGG